MIQDANLRAAYMREIQKMSNGYLEAVKQGKISVKDAVLEATELRNQILDATRKKNSAIGLAISQKEKAAGKTLEQILEYYAMEIKDPNKFKALRPNRSTLDKHIKNCIQSGYSYFDKLSEVDRNRVYYSVLKGSGKSNKSFNGKIKWMRASGRFLVVISFAYAGYEIYNADNKRKGNIQTRCNIGCKYCWRCSGWNDCWRNLWARFPYLFDSGCNYRRNYSVSTGRSI